MFLCHSEGKRPKNRNIDLINKFFALQNDMLSRINQTLHKRFLTLFKEKTVEDLLVAPYKDSSAGLAQFPPMGSATWQAHCRTGYEDVRILDYLLSSSISRSLKNI